MNNWKKEKFDWWFKMGNKENKMKKIYVRYTGITTAKPCCSSLYGDENTLTWQMQNGLQGGGGGARFGRGLG